MLTCCAFPPRRSQRNTTHRYIRGEAQSETKHAHAIMDYVTKRNRLFRLRRLHQFPPAQVDAQIATFDLVIQGALDAAATDDDKEFGPS